MITRVEPSTYLVEAQPRPWSAMARTLVAAKRRANELEHQDSFALNPILRDLFGENLESAFVLGSVALGALVGGYALVGWIERMVARATAPASSGRWTSVTLAQMSAAPPGRYRIEGEIDGAAMITRPAALATEAAWVASVEAIGRQLPGLTIAYMAVDRFVSPAGVVGPLVYPKGALRPADWPAPISGAPMMRLEFESAYTGNAPLLGGGLVRPVRAWRADRTPTPAPAPAPTTRLLRA